MYVLGLEWLSMKNEFSYFLKIGLKPGHPISRIGHFHKYV